MKTTPGPLHNSGLHRADPPETVVPCDPPPPRWLPLLPDLTLLGSVRRAIGSLPAPLILTVHGYMEPWAAMTLLGDLGPSFLNCRSRGWQGKGLCGHSAPHGPGRISRVACPPHVACTTTLGGGCCQGPRKGGEHKHKRLTSPVQVGEAGSRPTRRAPRLQAPGCRLVKTNPTKGSSLDSSFGQCPYHRIQQIRFWLI